LLALLHELPDDQINFLFLLFRNHIVSREAFYLSFEVFGLIGSLLSQRVLIVVGVVGEDAFSAMAASLLDPDFFTSVLSLLILFLKSLLVGAAEGFWRLFGRLKGYFKGLNDLFLDALVCEGYILVVKYLHVGLQCFVD